MSRLAGRVAVVTGASRGIGEAAAKALAAEGASVVRMARSLRTGPGEFGSDIAVDLSDPAAASAACHAVLDAHGPPDVVVNNAGAFLLKPLADTTDAELERQLGANLRSAFTVARAFLPAMRQRGSGLLIQVGSIADHVAFPGNAAYAASKFALRGLHETLAAEYRGSGVRCTLVSPGPTDTAVWDPVQPDTREGFTPRARMLRPADVAEAIRWLATLPAHVHVDWLRLGPV
ncbi:MAG: SDR family oxidoreductase [Gemmatimonadales bacterium]